MLGEEGQEAGRTEWPETSGSLDDEATSGAVSKNYKKSDFN